MSRKPTPKGVPICSFCGRSSLEVKRMFSGIEATICEDCIQLCHSLIVDEKVAPKEKGTKHLPTPHEIKRKLDEYVIGQERAKKILSVAVYNHYKRVFFHPQDSAEIEKANIMLIGPTGTGKTLLARTLTRVLNVPIAICDATPLTEAGYVGEDVESILLRLIQASDYDIKLAEAGTIYLDEIDKLACRMGSPSITRDVSGEGVQQALLRILEGTISNVPPQGGRKHPEQSYIQFSTHNVLFICGGTFDGLEKLVRQRLQHREMGFVSNLGINLDEENLLRFVQPEDMIKYGIIPEFIGRIPVVVNLNPLSKEDLVRILTEPKDALCKQYESIFKMENVQIEFTQDGLDAIAEESLKRGLGARGLKSILEDVLLDTMFKLPSLKNKIEKCVVTREAITGKKPPKLKKKKKK